MISPTPFTTRLPDPENDCMSPFMEIWVFCDDGFCEFGCWSLWKYDQLLDYLDDCNDLTHWLPYDKIPHPTEQ